MTDTLKPCPFCGAKAARSSRWQSMDSVPGDGTRFLAITKSGIHRVDGRNMKEQEHHWKGEFWQEKPGDRYVAWMPLPPLKEKPHDR